MNIHQSIGEYPTLNPIYAGIALSGIFGPTQYSWVKRHILFKQMTTMDERTLRRLASNSGAKP